MSPNILIFLNGNKKQFKVVIIFKDLFNYPVSNKYFILKIFALKYFICYAAR